MVELNKEKESFENVQGVVSRERIEIPDGVAETEIAKRDKENLEVSSWIEKIEKQFARVPNDTSDVSDDAVVVQPVPQSDQPPVTLPVNQQQMAKGKTAKPDLGIAWLVTWAIRQIKILSRLGSRVRLQDMPEVK